MELIADRGRRVSVEEMNTTRLLAHARKQAVQRKFDDMLIVDVDAHHYENENFGEILPLHGERRLRAAHHVRPRQGPRTASCPRRLGYQDMGGRVTRYPMRGSEKTEPGRQRDVQLGERWMDAMSVDYSCLFPTGMLNIGLHPQKEMEVDLCWAYNRWLTEKVLPETDGRIFSMLCLPFSDPDACLRQVETFGDRKGVAGFMVTTVRNTAGARQRLHEGLSRDRGARARAVVPLRPELGRAGVQGLQPLPLGACARLHLLQHPSLTNWVVNGMGERFPKLPVIWIESGLAWIPFLMQRLDHEYMLRPSEAPLLKKKPSDYMRDMYYSSQPMEIQDMGALEMHVPHDQCGNAAAVFVRLSALGLRPAATIYDLPFLSEKAQAQHPRRHRGAAVQAAAAQREAKGEPDQVRQRAGLISAVKQGGPRVRLVAFQPY